MFKNIVISSLILCLLVSSVCFYRQKTEIERELWNAKIEKIESSFGFIFLIVRLTDSINDKDLAAIGKSEARKVLNTLKEMSKNPQLKTLSPEEFRARVENINEDFEKSTPEVALENLKLLIISLYKEM